MLKEDGTKMVTRYVIRRLKEPVTEDAWIALEQEVLDAQQVRRRMREKVSPMVKKIGEDQRREEKRRRMRLLAREEKESSPR